MNGVRPFAAVSASSPILPGAPLGNITQVESSGFSNYDAAWVSVTKRLSRGLQFETLVHVVEVARHQLAQFVAASPSRTAMTSPAQYGLSDFDARHRFVVSAIYALPFTGHVLTRGWQVAAVVQSQSGNPVNIVTSNSSLNGLPNTVRPDVTGPIRIIGSVGSVVRSVGVRGRQPLRQSGQKRRHRARPSTTRICRSSRTRVSARRAALQFRVDVFDLFNHPNFGPPGNIVGSPTFGKITRTRLPTGEAGSSRQIQLAARLSF